MGRVVIALVLVLVAAVGGLIHYFNAQPVEFDFLLGQFNGPLSVVLLLAFVIGVLVASGLILLRVLRLQMHLHRVQRRLQATETELRTLRNLPLTASPTEVERY